MVTIMSLWRNDASRQLESRAAHLLSKVSVHGLNWLWVVGDSTDDTEKLLRDIAKQARKDSGKDIRIIVANNPDVVGEDTDTRRIRSSRTATAGFARIPQNADFLLLHESDLVSPPDVIDRLLGAGQGRPCAGWPIITLPGAAGPQFYDTWAYCDTRGLYFTAQQTRPSAPFRVNGFGSVWIAPASLVRGHEMRTLAIRDLCGQWRAEEVPMFCDPNTEIVQPVGLWEPA